MEFSVLWAVFPFLINSLTISRFGWENACRKLSIGMVSAFGGILSEEYVAT